MDFMNYEEAVDASKWHVGDRVEREGQRYVCEAFEPHIRRDGRETALVVLRSDCAQCGASFTFKVPALVAWRKLMLSRRCAAHKRPGVKVKKAAPVKAAKRSDVFG